eukprot:759307-Rhodomonas_salina.1
MGLEQTWRPKCEFGFTPNWAGQGSICAATCPGTDTRVPGVLHNTGRNYLVLTQMLCRNSCDTDTVTVQAQMIPESSTLVFT